MIKGIDISDLMDASVDKKTHGNTVALDVKKGANSFIIPAIGTRATKRVELKDTTCSTKRLAFDFLIAAYNHIFHSERSPLSAAEVFSKEVPLFIAWLNPWAVKNKLKLLHNYRDYHVNVRGNKSTNIRNLRGIFSTCMPVDFVNNLNYEERQAHDSWSKIKLFSHDVEQLTLTKYFQEIQWLRDDEFGIGNRLFTQLSSPSETIKSLKITAGLTANLLHQAKTDILSLLKKMSITKESLPNTDTSLSNCSKAHFYTTVSLAVSLFCKQIINFYHQNLNKEQNNYKFAISILLTSLCKPRAQSILLGCLESSDVFSNAWENQKWDYAFKTRTNFTYDDNNGLFHLKYLRSLLAANESNQPLPLLKFEKLCFTWVMASMAVQPSDIFKLKPSNFTLIRSQPKRPIKVIECEYFKGRAKTIHTTDGLDTKKPEGQLVLRVIQNASEDIPLLNDFKYPDKLPSNLGDSTLQTSTLLMGYCILLKISLFDNKIIQHHIDKKVSSSFYQATKALLDHGQPIHAFTSQATKKMGCTKKEYKVWTPVAKALWLASSCPAPISIFGLSYIKNTSVHAESDPIDVDKLINYRSHSGKTEALSYLTEDNEKWLNTTGRMTRSVMHDLIQNVFNPMDNVNFNSEFSRIAETVNGERNLVLSRMERVTQQTGKINDIGIMGNSTENHDGLPTILVCDNVETAFKVRAYQELAQKNAKKLLRSNPDHFFRTVLPNLEICAHIETLLSPKHLKLASKQLELHLPHPLTIFSGL